MSVYRTKEFSRFARKAELGNAELLEAAKAVASGQWDADLGGGVFKQRIAREGGGKSGGFRTIILFKVGGHSFFVYGFAKNEKANITPKAYEEARRKPEPAAPTGAPAVEGSQPTSPPPTASATGSSSTQPSGQQPASSRRRRDRSLDLRKFRLQPPRCT